MKLKETEKQDIISSLERIHNVSNNLEKINKILWWIAFWLAMIFILK